MSLIEDLHSLGYKKFKIIHQGDNFKQISLQRENSQLKPLLYFYYNGLKKHLGKTLKFKYSYGSSGPFGEETDGDWQSYEDVKETYRAFTEGKNGQAINPYSWFDFHASK